MHCPMRDSHGRGKCVVANEEARVEGSGICTQRTGKAASWEAPLDMRMSLFQVTVSLHSTCTDFVTWFSERDLISLVSKCFCVCRVISPYNEILSFWSPSAIEVQCARNVVQIQCATL